MLKKDDAVLNGSVALQDGRKPKELPQAEKLPFVAKYAVTVTWSDDDEGYIAIVPELPGCSAFGTTPDEVIRECDDAIAAWLQAKEAKDVDPFQAERTEAQKEASKRAAEFLRKQRRNPSGVAETVGHSDGEGDDSDV